MNIDDIFGVAPDVEASEERDTLGGFSVWETNVYNAVIKTCYMDKFAGGSIYMNFIVECEDENGNKLQHTQKETVWSAKTNGNYYVDSEGKKRQLFGVSTVDSTCKLLLGKNMQELTRANEFTTRKHKIYNPELKAEVIQERMTIVPLTNVPCKVALQKTLENKSEKVGNTYAVTSEVIETNKIVKFLAVTGHTYTEKTKGLEATWMQEWVDKFKGQTKDETKKGLPKPKNGGGSESAIPAATALTLDI